MKLILSLLATLVLPSCYYVGVGYTAYPATSYTSYSVPIIQTRTHHITRSYNYSYNYNPTYYRFSGSTYLYEYKDLPTCVRVQVW